MMLTADAAFAAYEAVRPRLPAAVPPGQAARRVATLDAVADLFDVFLLDAFGVLNIGETAIPGTAERIEGLRRAGKRVLVVSNAASVPLAELERKYRRLGYDFAPEDIITSRAAMAAALGAMAPRDWGVMGAEPARFDDLGDLRLTLLAEDRAAYDAAEGFLLIGSGAWTEDRQALLEASLGAAPRPVLVANPDIVAPRETGFSAEPGHFAHRLADRLGLAPAFYGKPFANIYDLVFARLGPVDKARVLMVGDSLHTDILGAQAAGVRSALVADYGFFAGHDVEAAIDRAGIVPDFVLDRP
ncbi:HAD-IIA family hydrolase [Aestuariicoccus sp. MJ-SS9]|uniref:HAD-IIA family hydrolase n=1 Tax=Aestuariicoccus sp. MJ-SS9 TaxID=3079855 RepID=UPI002907AFDE|nr:HAD hydrolase-like protein [Aestuariicoccus sp. MJ-SS9]MDU8910470.1 HAD hydrolase-like protein [Aestuariicoccus sp. MJ-SS9]